MSHIDPSPLAGYESLSDPNLTSFFNNSRMKKHLIKSGLITRRGEVVSEKVFRLNNARKEHQRHVRDLLAQAIVHKALDMERHRQMQVKKQLEEIGKFERVRRVRADRALRGDEDVLPLLTPRKKQKDIHSKQKQDEKPLTTPNLASPLVPNDAPYNTRSSRIKTVYPKVEIDNQHLSQLDQEALRSFTHNLGNFDLGSGVSPYNVPVLDPASRQVLSGQNKQAKSQQKCTNGRSPKMKSQKPHQLRAKSSTLSRSLHRHEPPMIHRNHPQSKCLITFKYLGQIVQLDCEKEDPRDDIAVYQQHCGGENLCVYNGKILSGETFTIMSQRHRGFPFSLTFFLNGIQAERLSTCCEYKHKTGFKLGSKSSYFGFIKVHGAHPCYKCIVSQGKVKPVQQYNPHVPSNSRNSKNMRRRRRQLIKSSSSDDSNEVPNSNQNEDKYSTTFSSDGESSSVSSVTSLTNSDLESGKQPKNNGNNTENELPETVDEATIQYHQISSRTSDTSSLSDSSTEGRGFEENISSDVPNLPISDLLKSEREISITNLKLTEDQCAELCSALRENKISPSVHSIVINNLFLSNERLLDIFAALGHCKSKLTTLDIGKNEITGTVMVNSLLELLKKLEIMNLILDENPLTDNDMETLMAGLSSLYKQHHARRNEQQVIKHLVKDIINVSTAEIISETKKAPVTEAGELEQGLPEMSSEFPLTSLSLNKIKLGARGMKAVADFLVDNPSLRSLHLNGNSLTSTGILPLWQGLLSGRNNNLKQLFLAKNQFGDQGIAHLHAMKCKTSGLNELNLNDNGITEKGGNELLNFVRDNEDVKKVRLSRGNRIKHKTLKGIRKIVAQRLQR